MDSSESGRSDNGEKEISPELQKLNSMVERITKEPATINDKEQDGYTALHWASRYGDEKVIQTLLSYKPDVNVLDEDRDTPLHFAGSAAVASLLLANGAAVNAVGSGNITPLHVSLEFGVEEVAAVLIQHGADVNMHGGDHGLAPLHLCTSRKIAKLLLDSGAEVDVRDEYLRTPLHIAVEYARLDIVSILLDHGASVSATRKDRKTPLHLAKSASMVKLLLDRGAFVNARDNQGSSPLHTAVKTSEPSDFREIVKLLLQAGANASAEDVNRNTALHHAVKNGKDEKVLALLANQVPFFTRAALDKTFRIDDVKISTKIGRLLDASIKLKIASLRLTEENLEALAHNPDRDRFKVPRPSFGDIEPELFDFHYMSDIVNEFELECQQEVEAWKSHKVTDSMSLDYIVRTDSVTYLSNKPVLNTLRTMDYKTMYPIYESFMMHKITKDKLIVSAFEPFKKLLECGETNVPSLPDKIVYKILVSLDGNDIKKLISCGHPIE